MTTAIKGAAPADISSMESVAKALGLVGYVDQDQRGLFFCVPAVPLKPRSQPVFYRWLDDDGDAQRAAVQLQLTVCNEHSTAGVAYCMQGDRVFPDVHALADDGDEIGPADYAATRRAVFLAAAAIGEAMP